MKFIKCPCKTFFDHSSLGLCFRLIGKNTLYRGIDQVKFKNMVKPGDLCEITCTLDDKKAGLYFCSAKLCVEGKLCVSGKLTIALLPKA